MRLLSSLFVALCLMPASSHAYSRYNASAKRPGFNKRSKEERPGLPKPAQCEGLLDSELSACRRCDKKGRSFNPSAQGRARCSK